jgi:hypothetical protein
VIVNRANAYDSEEEEEESMANEQQKDVVKFALEEDDVVSEPTAQFHLQGSGSTSSLESNNDDGPNGNLSTADNVHAALSMK